MRPTRTLAAVGLALALLFAASACRKASPPLPEPKSTASAPAATPEPRAQAAAPAAAVPELLPKLMGRWTRSDGGYALELRDPGIGGVLKAAYFNPNPIRVSRAMWLQAGEGMRIMVELNDVGYPGSTYILTYHPPSDRLVGTYHQPVMNQTFEIDFVR